MGAGLSAVFSQIRPATQETQDSSFKQIVGSVVAGTPAIIQAIKQPTQMYSPALAGTSAGAATGAAQSQQIATPTWVWFAIGGAALAALGAAVLAIRK